MGKLGSCLRPRAFANLLQLQSQRQRSLLKGAKHLSGGGAKSKLKCKSCCLQKSKLVNWGGQTPSPGASPELLDGEFKYFFVFCIFILSPESSHSAVRARLGVAIHLSSTPRLDNPTECLCQRHWIETG